MTETVDKIKKLKYGESVDGGPLLNDGSASGVECDVEPVESVESIKQDKTKGHVLDVGPGCIAVELPCGYVDEEGTVHSSAVVREMRGHEEDILAGGGPILVRTNAIVGNCLVSLGSISEKSTLRRAVGKLMASDIKILLIAIRRASLGDKFDSYVTCPECKNEQHITLDLSEVGIVPMPDRVTRKKVSTLPSGTEIGWHVLSNDDEEWLGEKRKKKMDLLTLGLLARIDSIGDSSVDRDKSYRKAINMVKDLSSRDRNALRTIFEKEEGSVDTSASFECTNCGHIWEGNMDVGQKGFFFPSLVREASTR